MKTIKKWVAYYMPATDGEDPSKDFDTKKEAEDYRILSSKTPEFIRGDTDDLTLTD